MVEYTLEQLLEDAAAKHTRPTGAGKAAVSVQRRQFAEVWETIDRYVSACLEQRRGVALTNFCRIGWQAVKLRGQSTYRPYFQIADSFCRAYNASPAKYPQFMQDEDVCPMEDFNFSKAAIRFSTKLTKDHVFSGLRFLVQQLGLVVSQGRSVSVGFTFGKLVSEDREVRMAFAPELYRAHGLEVPVGCRTSKSDESSHKLTVTFAAAPSESSLQALSIMGNGLEGAVGSRTAPLGARRRGGAGGVDGELSETEGGACGSRSVPAPPLQPGVPPQRTELLRSAHDDALHRQITALETRASEAMRDRAEFEGHLCQGMAMDERARELRQARRRENAEFLQQQIEADRCRKTAEKAASVTEASDASVQKPPPMPRLDIAAMHRRDILTSQAKEDHAHELASVLSRGTCGPSSARIASPSTVVSQAEEGSRNGAQKEFREALEEQIQAKKAKKEAMQQFEKRIEANMVAAQSREASARRELQQAARAQEREMLGAAWREEAKIRDIRKTIEAIELGKNVSGKASSVASGGGGRPLSERQRPPPWAGELELRPGSSRGGGSGHASMSSGAMSARRHEEGAPRSARGEALGAAALLALQQKAAAAAA